MEKEDGEKLQPLMHLTHATGHRILKISSMTIYAIYIHPSKIYISSSLDVAKDDSHRVDVIDGAAA